MANKNEEIKGDLAVSRDLAVGGNAKVVGDGTVGGNLVVRGWLDARNIKGPNKGMYDTPESLNEKQPRPQAGWWAIVGTTFPAEIYRECRGEWDPTGEYYDVPNVDSESWNDIVDFLRSLPKGGDSLEDLLKAIKERITEIDDNVQNAKGTTDANSIALRKLQNWKDSLSELSFVVSLLLRPADDKIDILTSAVSLGNEAPSVSTISIPSVTDKFAGVMTPELLKELKGKADADSVGETVETLERKIKSKADKTDLESFIDGGRYNEEDCCIELLHGSTVIASVDAAPFIKDGMVDDVRIDGGYLEITFNTASGKQPIKIAVTKIFNPADYYCTKQIDAFIAELRKEIKAAGGGDAIDASAVAEWYENFKDKRVFTGLEVEQHDDSVGLLFNSPQLQYLHLNSTFGYKIPAVDSEGAGVMTPAMLKELDDVVTRVDSLSQGILPMQVTVFDYIVDEFPTVVDGLGDLIAGQDAHLEVAFDRKLGKFILVHHPDDGHPLGGDAMWKDWSKYETTIPTIRPYGDFYSSEGVVRDDRLFRCGSTLYRYEGGTLVEYEGLAGLFEEMNEAEIEQIFEGGDA